MAAFLGPMLLAALLLTGLTPAPDFPTQDGAAWIGPPQSWLALRGKVVVLDVWTFG